MPKLLWSLCCEKPIIDSKTNSLSLIGILEQINVPRVPIVVAMMLSVVSLWQKDDAYKKKEETFKHRIKIELPLGTTVISPIEYQTIIPNDKVRIRTLNGIAGIPVNKEGILYFIIELCSDDKWQEKQKIPVEIKIKK